MAVNSVLFLSVLRQTITPPDVQPISLLSNFWYLDLSMLLITFHILERNAESGSPCQINYSSTFLLELLYTNEVSVWFIFSFLTGVLVL